MKPSPVPNRRRFLKQGASALAAAASPLGFPAILRSSDGVSPNSKLQVASIGVGGMGLATMKGVVTHPKVEITGLCDVDASVLAVAARNFPDAVATADWRELLSGSAIDKFDALTIGIPDHMHAAPAVTALRARKHLYLQKPMASTVHECRVITAEANKAGVVTQLGNQGRSSQESRMAVELIQSGAIGKVKEVLIWENKLDWWPKNTELHAKPDQLPEGFNWDLWLGVREGRPWLDNTYHPKAWRAWFDFGVGEMGDMGCHHFDPTFDALDLTAPLRVRQVSPAESSSGPLWGKRRQVELEFPGPEFCAPASDTIKVTWHDGDLRPDASRIPLPPGMKEPTTSGTCWLGETGSIYKDYRKGNPVVIPADGSEFPAGSYPTDLKPMHHYHGWVDAIVEGGDARSIADFSHGGPLTESVLVGAIADRFAGEWLEWDREKLVFSGHEGATELVRREYREGWTVEGLG